MKNYIITFLNDCYNPFDPVYMRVKAENKYQARQKLINYFKRRFGENLTIVKIEIE